MKPALVVITSCAMLFSAFELADAQQGPHRIHPLQPPMSGVGDLGATNMIVSDTLVLPLLGMSDHIEGRLAFLKTELKITQAQMSLWNSFAAAARANAARENAMIAEESSETDTDWTPPSLPSRLEAHERHLSAHLKMLQDISAVLLPLYVSFS